MVASNASGASVADLVRVDDPARAPRRPSRGPEVAGGDGDLDLGRKAAEPEERLLDLLERARDSRHGRVDLALGETEEREARLRIAAQLVRRAVRLLRAREVAAPTADLADLVVAAGRDLAVEVVELLARRQRLRLGRRPVAAEPQGLGSVDPAGAGKAADVELVAPAVRRLRPLGRAPEVAEVLARADRDAVDEPGRVRSQVAAHRRRGRLVEQSEPLVDLAGLDAARGPSRRARASGRRGRRRAARARRPRRRARPRSRSPSANIALSAWMSRSRPCSGDSGNAVEQPLGAREPAARDGERAAALVVPGQRERDPRGAERVARGACTRRTRARGARSPPRAFRSTRPPRRSSRDRRRSRLCGSRLAVRRVRRAPCLARGGCACFVERVDHLGHERLIVAVARAPGSGGAVPPPGSRRVALAEGCLACIGPCWAI